jgi:hypothetical protein
MTAKKFLPPRYTLIRPSDEAFLNILTWNKVIGDRQGSHDRQKVPPSQVHCDSSIRLGLLEHPDMEQGDWLDKGQVTPTKVPPSQVHRYPTI